MEFLLGKSKHLSAGLSFVLIIILAGNLFYAPQNILLFSALLFIWVSLRMFVRS